MSRLHRKLIEASVSWLLILTLRVPGTARDSKEIIRSGNWTVTEQLLAQDIVARAVQWSADGRLLLTYGTRVSGRDRFDCLAVIDRTGHNVRIIREYPENPIRPIPSFGWLRDHLLIWVNRDWWQDRNDNSDTLVTVNQDTNQVHVSPVSYARQGPLAFLGHAKKFLSVSVDHLQLQIAPTPDVQTARNTLSTVQIAAFTRGTVTNLTPLDDQHVLITALAFPQKGPVVEELYLWDVLSKRRPELLFDNTARGAAWCVSMEHSRLAYGEASRDLMGKLREVDPLTKQQRIITVEPAGIGGYVAPVTWSHDGHRLIVASGHGWYIFNLETHVQTPITGPRPQAGTEDDLSPMTWSADDQWLAGVVRTLDITAEPVGPDAVAGPGLPNRLAVMATDTGEIRYLPLRGDRLVWSPCRSEFVLLPNRLMVLSLTRARGK